MALVLLSASVEWCFVSLMRDFSLPGSRVEGGNGGLIGCKLDGVGPIDNRPSTNKLHHFTKKKCDIWLVTCDMWHITYDTWHATCDMWHVWGWTWYQNFSPLALPVCDLWYYEDLEEKAHLLNQWINHEAVYRTAPATPGVLNILAH